MKNKNIVLSKLNVAVVGMILIIIYLLYVIFAFAGKKNVFSYEVRQGSLAKVNNYTGVAIRQEEIVTTESSGHVRYFARESEHVGIGDLVYTIDASDIVKELINNNSGGENSISNSDLAQIKNDIANFCSYYDDQNFYRTYDFLYSMQGAIIKFANMNMIEEISKANAEADSVKFCNADKTGYVIYNVDNYESLTVDTVTEDIFDITTYEKTQLITSEDFVDIGKPVYKLITSEKWSIAIQLERERAEELANEGYVKVRFLEDQRELSAKIDVFQAADNYFGILSFNSSVLAYSTERFIDIEIITQENTGLKIPMTSIVYKEFYLVPVEFKIRDGDGENKVVFTRKVFKEDGTVTVEKLSLEVYAEQDGYYYIDDTALNIGDYLVRPGDSETVQRQTSSNSDQSVPDGSSEADSSVSDSGDENTSDSAPAIVPDRLVLPEEDTDSSSSSSTTDSDASQYVTASNITGYVEYPVATKGELCGVYNMNMGYADFRRINILYENEEYAIVASNSRYGLREYDFIVLDSSAIDEGDYTYE